MGLDERNDLLNRKIGDSDLPDAVGALVKTAGQNRARIRLLAISLALDILLTLFVSGLTYKTSQLAHLAQSNKMAVVANCEVSNDSRRNNRVLWDYILAIPPTQPLTSTEEAQRAQFKKLVNTTFAERNCRAEINQK